MTLDSFIKVRRAIGQFHPLNHKQKSSEVQVSGSEICWESIAELGCIVLTDILTLSVFQHLRQT